jgi:hypothetical protein
MARPKTLTRRGFLIGTTVVGGAVVFGSYLVARPQENPLAEDLGAQQATFNPWVRIGPDGITLITPHADLGQGTTHMQAILLAEEMDLELDQFTTAFGEPAAAYYNRGFAAEGAEVIAALTPLPADAVRGPMGAALKVAGLQGTGGSTAAADSFDKLRQAGASARETLKLAASQDTGVPVAQLSTARGAVVLPDGTRRAYTELAGAASALDPVQNVALRPASSWRLVGQPTERLDIRDKSTGRTVYGIDLVAEGMVHATVVTNPRRGPMRGYDAAAARDMPGVQGVVEVTNGLAVLADSTWRAFKAARAIDFDWGPPPIMPNRPTTGPKSPPPSPTTGSTPPGATMAMPGRRMAMIWSRPSIVRPMSPISRSSRSMPSSPSPTSVSRSPPATSCRASSSASPPE